MGGRTIFGAALIFFGAGFLMQQLGYFHFGAFFATWWPMVILFLGASQLFARPPAYTPALILIVIGAFLQMRILGYVQFNLFRLFWPMLLILIGIQILLNNSARRKNSAADSYLSNFNIFSGYVARVTSQEFRGGSVTSLFGASEIDLRQADLQNGTAAIDVTAMFGGSEIIVPSHWVVKADGIPVFGDWENKTKHVPLEDQPSPVLHVRCLALFGGVTIRN